jgi:pyrimidine operon attenuation protein / uracil phosphoribosyltransferase
MILDKQTAEKKLRRMALEVAERNYGSEGIVLIGIKENGIFIAEKIALFLKEVFTGTVQVLSLEINKTAPAAIRLSGEADFHNNTILLVDDVANSGRTMLYALKPLLEHQPRIIQTLALVERTHKKFPIAVDYVGMSVSTTMDENIVVEVEGGEVVGAFLR